MVLQAVLHGGCLFRSSVGPIERLDNCARRRAAINVTPNNVGNVIFFPAEHLSNHPLG
jgi:hypothetical protein